MKLFNARYFGHCGVDVVVNALPSLVFKWDLGSNPASR